MFKMNYISNTFLQSHELFKSGKEAVLQNMPCGKDIIEIVKKAAEVATGIFNGVAPHLLSMSPWYISKMINFKGISVAYIAPQGIMHGYCGLMDPHLNWVGAATPVTRCPLMS